MKAIIILSVAILFASCGYNFPDSISGNGNVQERTFYIDTVYTLSLSNKLEATLIPSDSFKVVLQADENLHEFIFVEDKYGQLEIYCNKNIRMAKAKQVFIYANSINTVSVASGADFFNSDSLEASAFTVEVSSGADASLFGSFGSLYVNGSSAADIEIGGNCEKLEVNMSSAADLRAFELVAQTADVVVSSAAEARVHVTEEARFEASSAGDIIYEGDPKLVRSNSSSAGDIKKARN